MTDEDQATSPDEEGPYEVENGTCAGGQPLNWCGRCQPMNEQGCPGGNPSCILVP